MKSWLPTPRRVGACVVLLQALVLSGRLQATNTPQLEIPSIQTTVIEDFVRQKVPPRGALPRELEVPHRAVIEVMVLYTTEAREYYGEAVVQSKIALGVALLNEACKRSGVNAYFRVVHTAEVTWHTESVGAHGAQDELDWVSSDETVAALREAVGADLVSLFVRYGLPTGGVAQLPGSFSVFNGAPFIFAHETGHNLGCEHDRAHSTQCQSERCNFGYSFIPPGTTDVYGDIMSYVGSQIEQFSNCTRYFLDAPTGLPEGHVDPAGKPDSADSVSCINEVVPYLALSRPSLTTILDQANLSNDGHNFFFSVCGPYLGECALEWSSDLISWNLTAAFTLDGSGLDFIDDVRTETARFYRARTPNGLLPTQVGFIKLTVPQGLSMIANQLECPDDTLGALLADVPEGTQVYKWNEGRQEWLCGTFSFGEWDHPEMTLHPGEGVIIRNVSADRIQLSFVGEVNIALHNRMPLKYSIRSSAVPCGGNLTSLLRCVPFGPGCQIYRMTQANGAYTVYTFDGESWSPSEPTISLGEAFWCRNPLNAFIWELVLKSQ